jgi:hypothetical protein
MHWICFILFHFKETNIGELWWHIQEGGIYMYIYVFLFIYLFIYVFKYLFIYLFMFL